MPAPVVTLLTDFGISDAYAGVMKGVILSTAPDARLVDLTHEVPPQAVLQGAFLLETAWRYFPVGSVHLAVVDPGVGTPRRRLALSAAGQFFVSPDNGLLSCALDDAARDGRPPGEPYLLRAVKLPPEVQAVEIDVSRLGMNSSATFEGRDVFAPVAARLARGAGLGDVGTTVSEMLAFPSFRAPITEGAIYGLVLHVDSFGNLITDIRARDLPPGAKIEVAGHELALAHTYAGAALGPCAVLGSSGFVEVALPNGSAAEALGIGAGALITVTPRNIGSRSPPSPSSLPEGED